MHEGAEYYSLRGGQSGYDRLAIFARKYWPSTSALFDRAGLGLGMAFIDVGCNGGRVSLEVASRVSSQGRVVGIDIDSESLSRARAVARERGLSNIEFREQRVQEWDEPSVYDAVYSRALLQHLRNPVEVVRRMWNAVKPGGLLMLEDADHDGWFCDPPSAAFDSCRRLFSAAIDRGGGDHAFGRKMYRTLTSAEVPDPHLSALTLCYHQGEEKTLAWSTLDAVAESVVKEGLASSAEVRSTLDAVWAYTEDPNTLIGGPLFFQAYARKPAE
jgi:ubiquinone/menaquinone biosynthesis C-methylase UbiE